MRLCYVSPRHDPARAHGHVKLLHGGARPAAKPTASKAAIHTIVHSALHEAQESQHSHELVIVFWAAAVAGGLTAIFPLPYREWHPSLGPMSCTLLTLQLPEPTSD